MKTALITGASRGIGAACAEKFSREGYDVIINYNRSEKPARELSGKLNCRAIRADVSDVRQVEAMFQEIGNVDILICNAGISDGGKMFCDTVFEDWNRTFSVNLGGTVNCIKAALPHMVHEKWGRIVTVSSMWGISGASCESVYSASKAAVIGFTKSLAQELGPSGITVNCVAPGVIDTDMNSCYDSTVMEELALSSPLGRIGTPLDVAEAVFFLANQEFITGQVLGVDGGFLL